MDETTEIMSFINFLPRKMPLNQRQSCLCTELIVERNWPRDAEISPFLVLTVYSLEPIARKPTLGSCSMDLQ